MTEPSNRKYADEIRNRAKNWSLEGDERLLQFMKSISKNLEDKCHGIETNINKMLLHVDEATVALGNVTNNLLQLQHSQFVENRVQQEDETVVKPPEVPTDEIKEIKQITSLSDLKKILGESLKEINKHYDKVTLELNDSDEDDEDEPFTNIIFRPKDPYQHRPLPYLIGSRNWKEKWHIGLLDSDSESEKEEDQQYSETSDSSSSLSISLPSNAPTVSESEGSVWGLQTTNMFAQKNASRLSSDDEMSSQLSSKEYKAKETQLRTEIERPYPRNIQNPPVVAKRTNVPLPNVNLFADSPPQTSSYYPDNSVQKGLFDDSEDEIDYSHKRQSISEQPGSSFFKNQMPQRKTVNLFDDEPPEIENLKQDVKVKKSTSNDLFADDDSDEFDDFKRNGIQNKVPTNLFSEEPPPIDDMNNEKAPQLDKKVEKYIDIKRSDIITEKIINNVKKTVNLFDDDEDDDFDTLSSIVTTKNKTNINSESQIIQPPIHTKPKITNLFDDDDDDLADDYFDAIVKNKKIESERSQAVDNNQNTSTPLNSTTKTSYDQDGLNEKFKNTLSDISTNNNNIKNNNNNNKNDNSNHYNENSISKKDKKGKSLFENSDSDDDIFGEKVKKSAPVAAPRNKITTVPKPQSLFDSDNENPTDTIEETKSIDAVAAIFKAESPPPVKTISNLVDEDIFDDKDDLFLNRNILTDENLTSKVDNENGKNNLENQGSETRVVVDRKNNLIPESSLEENIETEIKNVTSDNQFTEQTNLQVVNEMKVSENNLIVCDDVTKSISNKKENNENVEQIFKPETKLPSFLDEPPDDIFLQSEESSKKFSAIFTDDFDEDNDLFTTKESITNKDKNEMLPDISQSSKSSIFNPTGLFDDIPPDDNHFIEPNKTSKIHEIFYDDFADSFPPTDLNISKPSSSFLFSEEPPLDDFEDISFIDDQPIPKQISDDIIQKEKENEPIIKTITKKIRSENLFINENDAEIVAPKLPPKMIKEFKSKDSLVGNLIKSHANTDDNRKDNERPESNKSKPLPKKLNQNLSINVAALLPGAKPPSLSSKNSVNVPPSNATFIQNEDIMSPEEEKEILGNIKNISSTKTPEHENSTTNENSNILSNLNKSRAKIQTKRRPSTRRGRQETYTKSVNDSTVSKRTENKKIIIENDTKKVLFPDDEDDDDDDDNGNDDKKYCKNPISLPSALFFDDEPPDIFDDVISEKIENESATIMSDEFQSKQSDEFPKYSKVEAKKSKSVNESKDGSSSNSTAFKVTATKQKESTAKHSSNTKSLFDSDDDEDGDIFGSAKATTSSKTIKKVVGVKSSSSQLFGDSDNDDDDDAENLFDVSKKSAFNKKQPVKNDKKLVKKSVAVNDPLADLLK